MTIIGVHTLLYTSEPEAVRSVFADVFGFESVDAGGGWLIFALPPAELGVHPSEADGGAGTHAVSLMCDDIASTVEELRAKGISIPDEPRDEGFGVTTMMQLPGGLQVQLYEPRHPTAI